MMFNASFDCCAWGGSRFANLDGLNKVWRVTWEPPWGYLMVTLATTLDPTDPLIFRNGFE